ncbi:hypothetical protein I6F07_28880 [Ensifer sp. IC4062]|nr:hypothetical protein [Ensifer sp. IC4062]MCA1444144.1 hypothetical protein [Ensifer sp. IC4062]
MCALRLLMFDEPALGLSPASKRNSPQRSRRSHHAAFPSSWWNKGSRRHRDRAPRHPTVYANRNMLLVTTMTLAVTIIVERGGR